MVKKELEWTIEECYNELCNQLIPFKEHAYIKRKQQEFFISMKQIVDGKTIVLQVDYAENYSIIFQDEIQSAHWSHGQCSVFTAYSWIGKDDEQGFTIVSDNLLHGKVSVSKFLDILIETIVSRCAQVETVHIFSYGAASQFKSKFIMSILHVYELRHDIKIYWNYFV